MRAANGNGIWLQAHEIGEGFAALDHGCAAIACGNDLGIIVFYCCRDDQDRSIINLRRLMTFLKYKSVLLQAFGNFAGLQIGTRDVVAEIQQNLGEAAHTDAADTHKMDFSFKTRHELPPLQYLVDLTSIHKV